MKARAGRPRQIRSSVLHDGVLSVLQNCIWSGHFKRIGGGAGGNGRGQISIGENFEVCREAKVLLIMPEVDSFRMVPQ